MKNSLKFLVLFFLLLGLIGCEKKGPAEKLGESIDDTVENVEDAMEEKGPLEKLGEDIDDKIDE